MKVKTISRTASTCTRERSNDIFQIHKNPDPLLHPFEGAREYSRALNATKLDRLFAKPFVAALSGHVDGVYALARHPGHLTSFASGSGDGEVRLWNLATRECSWSRKAHAGSLRGLAFMPSKTDHIRLISCGDDKFVKLWGCNSSPSAEIMTYQGDAPFTEIDCHRTNSLFATSGARLDIWNPDRAEPIQSFTWGADTVTFARFSPVQTNIVASLSNDRAIVLHDLRLDTSLAKVILTMRSNALCWNPMEAYYFSVANEDHNVYTFDMRFLKTTTNVMRDHVSAVIDLDYSPTGHELVTGGYDRSIRIYDVRKGHSRDIYHARRMQRLFAVKFSMDSKYVVSGSDDGNVRLWKTNAAEKLGTKNPREEAALEYADALKQKFAELPEIKRIATHRRIPKAITGASKVERIQRESIKRKEENRRRHSKPGTVPKKDMRKEPIITTHK